MKKLPSIFNLVYMRFNNNIELINRWAKEGDKKFIREKKEYNYLMKAVRILLKDNPELKNIDFKDLYHQYHYISFVSSILVKVLTIMELEELVGCKIECMDNNSRGLSTSRYMVLRNEDDTILIEETIPVNKFYNF